MRGMKPSRVAADHHYPSLTQYPLGEVLPGCVCEPGCLLAPGTESGKRRHKQEGHRHGQDRHILEARRKVERPIPRKGALFESSRSCGRGLMGEG